MLDYVDLFAGCGGWDVAATACGLRGVGIEIDSIACRTRGANGLKTIMGDVTQYRYVSAKGLIASPPCQEWSVAGKGTSSDVRAPLVDLIQDRGWQSPSQMATYPIGAQLACEPLFWAYAAHLSGKPYRWLLLEQVAPVEPVWDAIARELQFIGYHTWVGVLNAADYGVPQSRRRAILSASLDHPVGGPVPRQRQSVISDFLTVDGYDGMMRASRSSPGLPRSMNEPAWTLTATGNAVWIHSQDYANVPGGRSVPGSSAAIRAALPANQDYRRLTVEEMSTLQTFPRDFYWVGSHGDKARQIGNAVPPKLAEQLLRTVL